jgi:hypothetical protein
MRGPKDGTGASSGRSSILTEQPRSATRTGAAMRDQDRRCDPPPLPVECCAKSRYELVLLGTLPAVTLRVWCRGLPQAA